MNFIDLTAQFARVETKLRANLDHILSHGRFIMGPEVAVIEERLAEFVGVKHCIGVASGTDALLIALMALGVGRGDEVITSPFSFVAAVEVIALLGATPRFVDVERDTGLMDVAQLEAAISPACKAIIPVSLYGQCADMEAINAIAGKYRIPVIEDAAQSFGARYRGSMSGALSEIGCTSFFPSKPLGCYGDGGACFTNDDALATKMRQIRVHGQDRRYHHALVGVNGRLDTMQAAILDAKLDVFPDEVDARWAIGQRYTRAFDDLNSPTCRTLRVLPHNTSVYAQYTILVEDRARVIEALDKCDIPTAVHYPIPLYAQPAFNPEGRDHSGEFPNTEYLTSRVISLPMHPYLSDVDQDRVVDMVAQATR